MVNDSTEWDKQQRKRFHNYFPGFVPFVCTHFRPKMFPKNFWQSNSHRCSLFHNQQLPLHGLLQRILLVSRRFYVKNKDFKTTVDLKLKLNNSYISTFWLIINTRLIQLKAHIWSVDGNSNRTMLCNCILKMVNNILLNHK